MAGLEDEDPPGMGGMERLARASAGRPWLVIATWILILIIAVLVITLYLDSALTTEQGFTGEPESARAEQLIEDELRGPPQVTETVIVRSGRFTVDDEAFRTEVRELASSIRGLGDDVVGQVITYLEAPPEAGLVGEEGRGTVIPVTMVGTVDDASENIDRLVELVRGADDAENFEVLITGQASIGRDFQEIAEQDLIRGEAIGAGVALIILLVVFGTVVAALLPLGLAILAITVAIGLSAIVGQIFELAFFVTNMITMMGLAVGIDYSLFIVSRFREERRAGLDDVDAIGRTGTTASRAVLFSGLTVILALLGLFLVPTTIFRALSIGAVLVVFVSVAAALTLLPALFGLLGERINSFRVPVIGSREFGAGSSGGFWDKVTHGVMDHAVLSVMLATGLLVAASVSYLDIQIGTAGVSSLPERAETKEAFEILQEDFSLGFVSPLEIVVLGDVGDPNVQQSMQELNQLIAGDDSFSQPNRPPEITEEGDLAVLTYPLEEDPNSDEALEAVGRVREEFVPETFGDTSAEVLVTGLTAINADFASIIDRYTPWVFAFVLGLSFIFLMVVFRSIIVPAKAIVLNLLSVGAAYGLIVLVFQKGYLRDVFGFQQIDVIENWIPLFLFAILFGLSMDYQVFLLARIREHYDEGRGNEQSVAFGLRTTAGIITGAAAIMMVVFAGFAAGDLVMFQQLGFGLAVAILIDASIIRVVLVPAAMKLLKDWNWYLPSWLEWIPDVRVEPADTTVEGRRRRR